MDNIQEVSCDCNEGQSWCEQRPCWGTPAQMKALIELGFGQFLWKDYYFDMDDIDNISPAAVGHEGVSAPLWPAGQCVFYQQGACVLHDATYNGLRLKPLEGAVACCKVEHDFNLHEYVGKLWDTEEGHAVIKMWQEVNGYA